MNHCKPIFCTLAILLSMLSVQAQNTLSITPSSAATSAQEIKSLFGEKINVSEEDISQFYLAHWDDNAPFQQSCSQPKARLTQSNSDFVSFDWAPVAPASRYVVSYLRLSDNSSETIITHEDEIQLVIPNDLYLVTFQTWCSSGKGPLGIIIIEKPLEFQEKNCDCPYYAQIWTDNFSDTNPLVYEDWSTGSSFAKYFVEVQFLRGPYASFVASITFGPDGPEIVSINPTCMTNVAYNYSDTYVYMHEPGDPSTELGLFGFFTNATSFMGPPQFSFNMDTDAMAFYDNGQVFIHQCRKRFPRSQSEEQLRQAPEQQTAYIKALENPFQHSTSLEYYLREAEEVSISLFDAYGQQVRVLKDQSLTEAGLHYLAINDSSLSNGMYFCILKTPTKTLSVKLLKAF